MKQKLTKYWKNGLGKAFLFMMCVFFLTLVPVRSVQAAKPLTAKDFIYKENGKKYNFIKNSAQGDWGWQILYDDEGSETSFDEDGKSYMQGNMGQYSISRGIRVNDTFSAVKQKYGNATKKKAKPTEKAYKALKYLTPQVNLSIWHSYCEYETTISGNRYTIRFLFNQKGRVNGVLYMKNLNLVYNYSNKQYNSKISFKTPNGEKVKKIKIGGKQVYVVPKGTKVAFKAFKNRQNYLHGMGMYLYDRYGDLYATSPIVNAMSDDNSYQTLTLDQWVNIDMYKLNSKRPLQGKYGKYSYFVLCLYADTNPAPKLAPDMIYFRFK